MVIKRDYFLGELEAVMSVVAVLTDSTNPATYWKVLKNRLKKRRLRNGYKL